MRLDEWMPETGWKSDRSVEVVECPMCCEFSELYVCDVGFCKSALIATSYESKTAGRAVSICSDHARVATEEKDETVLE